MTSQACEGEIHSWAKACDAIFGYRIYLVEGSFNGMVSNPPAVIFPKYINARICLLAIRNGRPANHVRLSGQDEQTHFSLMLLGNFGRQNIDGKRLRSWIWNANSPENVSNGDCLLYHGASQATHQENYAC